MVGDLGISDRLGCAAAAVQSGEPVKRDRSQRHRWERVDSVAITHREGHFVNNETSCAGTEATDS
jgi:hypothetical protein